MTLSIEQLSRYTRQTSAYGFSSSIEKSEAVAAANLAAAESLPTFPGSLQHAAEMKSYTTGHRTPVVAVYACIESVD
jgi:hypothetical protein